MSPSPCYHPAQRHILGLSLDEEHGTCQQPLSTKLGKCVLGIFVHCSAERLSKAHRFYDASWHDVFLTLLPPTTVSNYLHISISWEALVRTTPAQCS